MESEVVPERATPRNDEQMTLSHEQDAVRPTYLNPVYAHDFPDPFILKFAGEYWAYCTGFRRDGRCFGVMHSRDLVNWRELNGALAPLPGEHSCYWAPEVVYENGQFLMYYSVGNEKLMHLRVAVAEHPAGPFVDSGHKLTNEDFAIDAHVFIDEEGTRWLFYAIDFLTHQQIGTGTVRDRMIDSFTLAGEPQPVTRARYDWQVYDPARKEKGGVRWHTVEGPFVLRRKNLYYQMFSGGNWQNLTYGVSYATSDRIARDDEWEQIADGERVLPILRTIPEQVIGPGHNSVVRGPDNRQLFCVYHRWEGERGRVLAIDRLDWVGERMTVLGASTTPQFAPLMPTFAGFGEAGEDLGENWTCAGGRWSASEEEARQETTEGEATARCATGSSSFVMEVSLRALEAGETGAFGVALEGEAGRVLHFLIAPERKEARVIWRAEDGAEQETTFALPGEFQPRAFHLLRVVSDNRQATISLDERVVRWQGSLSASPDAVALVTQNLRAAFRGFELTVGWEDLFMQPERTLAERGWRQSGDGWRLQDDLLRFEHPEGFNQVIAKGPRLKSYEAVVNVRLEGEAEEAGGCYGFSPVYGADDDHALLTIEREEASGRWSVVVRAHGVTGGVEKWPLPENFDPFVMQQFRFRKHEGQLSVHCEATPLGEINTTGEATKLGLYAHRAAVAFDMVRVTALKQ